MSDLNNNAVENTTQNTNPEGKTDFQIFVSRLKECGRNILHALGRFADYISAKSLFRNTGAAFREGVIKKYFDFSSPTTKNDFFYFMVAYSLVLIIASFFDTIHAQDPQTWDKTFMLIVYLVLFIPALGIFVRRLKAGHMNPKLGYLFLGTIVLFFSSSQFWWYVANKVALFCIFLILFAIGYFPKENEA